MACSFTLSLSGRNGPFVGRAGRLNSTEEVCVSLISFHKLLIATAIVFCAGYAGWEARVFISGNGGTWSLVLAILFGLVAAGFVYYLIHLSRILGRETSR